MSFFDPLSRSFDGQKGGKRGAKTGGPGKGGSSSTSKKVSFSILPPPEDRISTAFSCAPVGSYIGVWGFSKNLRLRWWSSDGRYFLCRIFWQSFWADFGAIFYTTFTHYLIRFGFQNWSQKSSQKGVKNRQFLVFEEKTAEGWLRKSASNFDHFFESNFELFFIYFYSLFNTFWVSKLEPKIVSKRSRKSTVFGFWGEDCRRTASTKCLQFWSF